MQEKAPAPKITNKTTLSLVGLLILLTVEIGSIKMTTSMMILTHATTNNS